MTDDADNNVTFLTPKKADGKKDGTPKRPLRPATLADSWMLLLPELGDDEKLQQHAVAQLRDSYDSLTDYEARLYALKNVIIMTDCKEDADWAAEQLLKAAETAPFGEAMLIYAIVASDGVRDLKYLGRVSDITGALFHGDRREELIDFIEYSELYDHGHIAEFMANLFLAEWSTGADGDYAARYANALLRNGDLLTDEAYEAVAIALLSLIGDAPAVAYIDKPRRKKILAEMTARASDEESVDWAALIGHEAADGKNGKLVPFRKKSRKEEK